MLPTETISNIFVFAHMRDLLQCALVCREWRTETVPLIKEAAKASMQNFVQLLQVRAPRLFEIFSARYPDIQPEWVHFVECNDFQDTRATAVLQKKIETQLLESIYAYTSDNLPNRAREYGRRREFIDHLCTLQNIDLFDCGFEKVFFLVSNKMKIKDTLSRPNRSYHYIRDVIKDVTVNRCGMRVLLGITSDPIFQENNYLRCYEGYHFLRAVYEGIVIGLAEREFAQEGSKVDVEVLRMVLEGRVAAFFQTIELSNEVRALIQDAVLQEAINRWCCKETQRKPISCDEEGFGRCRNLAAEIRDPAIVKQVIAWIGHSEKMFLMTPWH